MATVVQWTRQEAKDRWGELLLREDLTLESLEAGLLRWMEDRPWRPISLSSSVSYLATSDGATLRVASAGQETLRLSAFKRSGDISVEFTVEVDGGTHLPRLQCIRYESPTRTLELWLYPQPAQVVRAASFEPPAALSVAPVAVPLEAPRLPLVMEPPPPAPDLLSLEVQIYYALHRVQACRGETVEVIHQPGGRFQVRGVVVDAERREQLIATLAPLAGLLVRVEIKSVQEALQEMGPAEVRSTAPPASSAPLPRKDVMRALANHFSDEEAAARFADQALASSEEVMREAQALRQLAERFYGGREPASPQARWMLQVMTYDHLRDLQAKLEATEQLVRPPLAKIAGPAAGRHAEIAPASAGSPREELQAIFSYSRQLNDRTRALLEGNGLAAELLDAFAPLRASVRWATDRALPATAQKVNAN
jgi:hypothetical protein